MATGTNEVKRNTKSIYERRKAALYALSLQYAALAWNYFLQKQKARPNSQGEFWFNRTAQAAARVFADAFRDQNSVGWFIAHGVSYGVYLELANDRRNEALRPIIKRYAGRFMRAVQEIYAAG